MIHSIHTATRFAKEHRHTLMEEARVAALLREAHTDTSPEFKPLQVLRQVAQTARQAFRRKPAEVV